MLPPTAQNVLVAPLDWGLGHVTRCIPIISALLKRGNSVIIAVSGPGKSLLATEFPGLEVIVIPAYRVRFPGAGRAAKVRFIAQLPRICFTINKERRWLKKLCTNRKIDLVISDNRYGLYNRHVHCIFITHQLYIRSGWGDRFDRALMYIHFRLIKRFSECWVPDMATPSSSLAGRLSHPPRTPPFPVTYLGLLSRFSGAAVADEEGDPGGALLVLLSGPEPQRSIAETLVLEQMNDYEGPALLVRGIPGAEAGIPPAAIAGDRKPGRSNGDLRIVNHLPSATLRAEIRKAAIVICRSGYSTLMDLVALRKTAILIPTPGQPEQEYLARYMDDKGWMIAALQENFSLDEAVKKMYEREKASGEKPLQPGSPELLFFNGDLPALTLR